jgi:hypothetical protein
MGTIISVLVELLIFIVKNIPLKAPKYNITSPKYKKLTVDKLPIIKTFENLDYKQLLNEDNIANGKDKKSVNPRDKNLVSPDTVCHRFDAPHNYIHDSAGDVAAYNLAQQQFNLNGFDFDVTQVIGLTNNDPVSTEYRWVKQIIEHLNRTFKFSYRVTNGFGSEDGSNTHIALFVAYYNFLRPHCYAYWGPLNSIPELEKIPTMHGKLQKLIELSQHLILEKQLA